MLMKSKERLYTDYSKKNVLDNLKKSTNMMNLKRLCELPLLTDYKYINIKLIERYKNEK